MAKFLDSEGLSHLWTKIKGYFVPKTDSTRDGSRVVVTNSSKTVTESSVTTTELGYLAGVTSNIQTQLNSKVDASSVGGVTSFGGEAGNITVRGGQNTDGSVNLTMSSKELQASIVGLGSAAYTASTAYATAAQGTLADNAVPNTRTVNGHALSSDVTVTKGDVGLGNVTNESKATMFTSAALTGTPTAPTATAGTSTTQIATTEFVTSAISTASAGLKTFKGVVNAGSAISGLTDYEDGWYWVVQTAGTYVGQTCEPGDMVFCISDYSSSYNAADFTVVQNNMDMQAITTAEIDAIAV